ncbi:MAG: phosphotransferase, partial [Planctomycetia bacterium]|nr:phosphotransferase [Planctomycetia bacterium]
GVSNAVLRVTPAAGEPFVLKQSRAQLRTRAAWFSRLDRVWREVDVMRVLAPLLPPGVVPRVLFEDRDNYLFAMEAAPADHKVWKQLLLEGDADPKIAAQLGTFLATIHRRTALQPKLAAQFGDIQIFVELRVDPFYRRIAEIAPDAAPYIERLIVEMFATPVCIVHADFSPKNVLITGSRIVLVDFETGHYGDPAFDLGFFLSHLLLKTVRHAGRFAEYAKLTTEFWRTYHAEVGALPDGTALSPRELERRTTGHLAGCMWARIDATSRIDYLDERQQQAVREFCRDLFFEPPVDWSGILERLRNQLVVHRLVDERALPTDW